MVKFKKRCRIQVFLNGRWRTIKDVSAKNIDKHMAKYSKLPEDMIRVQHYSSMTLPMGIFDE